MVKIKQKTKKPEKKHIDFKYNFSVYWSFLRKYKSTIFIILFFVSLMEIKHVLDKFLFKIIIDKGTESTAGIISLEQLTTIFIIIAGVYIGASLMSVVLHWVNTHLIVRLESSMMADLKRKYFNYIISLDHKFHTSHKTGSLISRLTRSSSAVERMNDVIVFNFAPLILQTIILTISLAYLDWFSAVIIFLTSATFISFSFYMQKLQKSSYILANKAEDKEKGNIADIFTNIDSIRYFGREKFIKQKFVNLSEETRKTWIQRGDFFRWMSSGESLILSVGTFFLIFFSLRNFLQGELTLGTLAFIYTAYVGLISPMFMFIHGIRNYYRAMADFQDLFEYGKIEKEIKDKPDAKPINIKEGNIEFKNVNFSYGTRRLFQNFNLKIPKNKKIAFVGHSGCGKTTLVKLLYRFHDIDKGEILIDDQNIKNLKQESLRGEMSIVPQEAVLFDDSIYNNIAFSNPKATREEVMKAIKFAQLDKIIKEFPKKEGTIVGERGVKLSGGEKQRVSIARAILANKKVLILDEATSALDSQTEHEIQKDLANLMQGRTSLIIAHRLSTIMHADTIVVMKRGKIIQMGAHRQLIAKEGEYKKLWDLQKGGYIK